MISSQSCFSETFKSIAELHCKLTNTHLPIPANVELDWEGFLAIPGQFSRLTVQLCKGLFFDPIVSPDADWPSLFRFLVVVLVLVAIWMYFTSLFGRILLRSDHDLANRSCRRCGGSQETYIQIDRRDVLKMLIEVTTPTELWYAVKLRSKRNGVRVEEEIRESRQTRSRGFNVCNLGSDQATLYLRQSFELGRASLLRELRSKVAEGPQSLEELCGLLIECDKEAIDNSVIKNWKREKPPPYEDNKEECIA